MNDVVAGLLAVAVGLFLCVRGHWALRLLLAFWGALIGLALGAALVDQWSGDGFLATTAGWVVGIVLGVLFALIAYFYYAISIVLAMASMGFVLGGTLASALGASQTWLLTLVGLVLGTVLAVLAIVTDLPALVLVVLSSAAGASALIGGLMLIFGSASLEQLTEGHVAADDHVFWYVAWPVVVVLGIFSQVASMADLRQAHLREAWSGRS